MAKRTFDLVVASVLLVLSAPISMLSAFLVKVTSPGPVIYRAPRAGRGGTEFAMFKFRTMRTGLDDADRRVTELNDSRITPVGSLLRKTKVDEIPQLVNVLRGEMSIVGPRPEDVGIVEEHYTERQRRTLDVRPGISSYAELRWYPDLTYHDPPPADVSIQEWYVARHLPAELEESLRYIEDQSIALDISVLLRTVWNVVRYSFIDPPKRSLPVQTARNERG